MAAAIFDQRAGDDLGAAIGAGDADEAVAHDGLPGRFGQAGPHQILGEIRRGRDADKGVDAGWPREGDQQRDPAAHGGADENDRALGQVVDEEQRIFGPAADGALLELALARAVSRVVEPEGGVAMLGGEGGKHGGLVAGHVAHEPRQKHQGGRSAWEKFVGEVGAVAAVDAGHGLAFCRAMGVFYTNRR